MNLDFSKIRSIGGSQNNGFEELICQLAHLQKPDNATFFIRKEGAGGDAGAECYWILQDGNEYCWQAKYFLGEMSTSRWKQIDDSLKTALKKHDNLKKYIVCLPIDRTDSRKTDKNGKKVISLVDEWNSHVSKWSELAKNEGKEIEFEYFGKHEILSLLSIDDPVYAGRALYWFNEPILHSKIFTDIVARSEKSLGERYTPEFHVDLPISKRFDGLCLNPSWWDLLNTELNQLKKQRDQFFKHFHETQPLFLDLEKLRTLISTVQALITLCQNSINSRSFIDEIERIKQLCSSVIALEDKFSDECEASLRDEQNSKEASVFHSFFYQFRQFLQFLTSNIVQAAEKKAALLFGEAGIGKSHLLCDLSLNRINQGLPTVFLLGQHYNGGNPLAYISDSLDLKDQRYHSVLGALDAAGEANKTQTLIVIDGINEGTHRDEWFSYIENILFEISRFKYVSILLSCRTTYLKHLIPDHTLEKSLITFEHHGFQGYEHRAAAKYLSMQGIVKPSAPILAPEFTNPLFLKTCCKALKSNKMTTFPKGLQGFSSLFDFYIESVERVIAQRKKYNPSEDAARRSLIRFSALLFPDNLSGLSYSNARKIINEFDPQPNKGDSLFDELMHENILSEDITYKDANDRGRPVIRFTYERFSDYFVAKQITENCTQNEIQEVFQSNHPIGKVLSEGYYYSYKGILEALAIIVAEKYKLELPDVLPKEISPWTLNEIFSDTIIWRSPNSITDRTLKLLNGLKGHGNQSPAMDILLKISTEPNHPWNAHFLHKNLIGKALPERDHFWSVHIALNDRSEDEDHSESIVRTLIDWACEGSMDDVEDERILLCAMTLIWFLTTSNRKVRDQATKSLVRLIHLRPHLLPPLIEKFHSVDDLYLVERFYAVAYGVVCNIDDDDIIEKVASIVYMLVFENGRPIAHLLLRDYARGLLEYALYKECLPKNILVESFRPPYKSDWPLDYPTEEDINRLPGDRFSSAIKSSLMGFPGDFGNYTMGVITDWSPTSLTVAKPESGYDLKLKFASSLSGYFKDQYIESIKPKEKIKFDPEVDKIKVEIILSQMSNDELEGLIVGEREETEKLINDISESLDPEQKEYFKWLSGQSSDQPATFNKILAQRWVCRRAYELGWTQELFSGFEQLCAHGRGSSNPSFMERIGKKYQWIALFEFLARLSDNVHWVDRGYSDLDDQEYFGPWQMHKRDIDPTIWIRNKKGKESYYNEKVSWWQNYEFPIQGLNTLDAKLDFLWSKKIIPDFSKLLEVKKAGENFSWTVLRGFWNQHDKGDEDRDMPQLDAWFRINSMIIRNSDLEQLKKSVKNQNLCDPDTIRMQSTHHQGFFKEYPWHFYYNSFDDNYVPNTRFKNLIPVNYIAPVSEYEWESGSHDFSLNQSISIYMPSKTLVQELGLFCSTNDFGKWQDKQGNLIFFDPSLNEAGPSFALIRTNNIVNWLEQNDMKLVWLIGGEKQLFTSYASTFYGRLVYSGLYTLESDGAIGNLWFKKER